MASRKPIPPPQRLEAIRAYRSYRKHRSELRRVYPTLTAEQKQTLYDYGDAIREMAEVLRKPDRLVDVAELIRADAWARWLAMNIADCGDDLEIAMAERTVSSSLSGDIIELLMRRGMTLTAIAQALGAGKSFVSRVKSRSRSLTIDHLVALEAAVGEPLPVLLLEATPIESVPPELRPLYRSTLKVVSGGKRRSPKRRAKAA